MTEDLKQTEIEKPKTGKSKSNVFLIATVSLMAVGLICVLILMIPSKKQPNKIPSTEATTTQKVIESKNAVAPKIDGKKQLDISVGAPIPPDRPVKGKTEVVVEGNSWFPDVPGGFRRKFGMYTVGEKHEFAFFPDGRNGIKIIVPFVMTDEMISGSDMSTIMLVIYDAYIEVVGQAIGKAIKYDRWKK